MANADQPPFGSDQYQPQTSGSNKGCLWGCLIAGGLIAGAFLCAGFGLYFFLSGQIEKYSSATPVELPSVEYTEEEMQALQSRITTFREKLEAGDPPEDNLVLTADDINAMIQANKELRGKAYVEIENDQVTGKVSIPLDGVPGGSGRFFNGSASFDVSMENGVLVVTVDQAEVKGEPVPEEFLAPVRQENLAQELYKDPQNAKFMRQFESIRIEDNQIILTPKREGPADDSDEASPADAEATGEQPAEPQANGDPATEAAAEITDGTAAAEAETESMKAS
jgi:hypothetical protein